MANLGELLIQAREEQGLTLEDAERDTRIARRYLEALESEAFDVIPAPVYARGFLRSYSQYLGLDPQEVLTLFPQPHELDTSTPRRTNSNDNRTDTARNDRTAPRRRDRASRGAVPMDDTDHDARARQRPRAQEGSVFERPPRPVPRTRPRREAPPEPAVIGAEPEPTPEHEPEPETSPGAYEPVIGVDIGVPSPASRVEVDPAARQRTMMVAAVAVGLVIVVVVLAFLLSRAGGDDDGSLDGSAPFATEDASGETTGSDTTGTGGSVDTGDTGEGGETDAGSEGTGGESATSPAAGVMIQAIGLDIDDARSQLESAGYTVEVIEQSDSQPEGTVIDQSPASGETWDVSRPVFLVVSTGPE
jgi:hypothetical protein